MSVEKKVPEIRFKGFSGKWNEEKIQELIDRQAIIGHLDGNHGELYPRINEFSNAGIPYISANDFVTGFMSFSGCKYLPIQRALQFKKGIAKDGDILFAHNATVGPVAKLTTSHDFVILSTTATYFRCDNKTLINDYLLPALSNKKFVEQYSRVMAQSTRNQVPITVQRKFSISIPENTSEQTQIGNYFQKLDVLINQHKQKHDKLSNIKKSMLEKMFPKQGETIPEIRFKGVSGEWEENMLSEIANVIDPHPSHRAPNAVDNGIPFIGIGDISDVGLVDLKNVRIVPNSIYSEHSARYTIEKGDFAYGRVASVGKIIDLSNNIGCEYTYSPTMAIVKPTSVYPAYLRNYLQTEVFKDHVANKTSGSTRKSLGVQDFRCLPVLFPLKEEQIAIGKYFQKLDTLISQHQQQITKLNNIKQACLSKMFV